jgi:hypothetical protein
MGAGTTDIPEIAKAGWFLCGLAAGQLLAVMRREVPAAVKTIMRELRGQAVGDTVQISRTDNMKALKRPHS